MKTQLRIRDLIWQDKKFLAGVILVFTSILLGIFGKVLIVAKLYSPVQVLTGLSLWVFSWIVLAAGILMVGWETIKFIRYRINHNVKKTIKKTYVQAKALEHKTKKLHRKGIRNIKKASKQIMENLKNG